MLPIVIVFDNPPPVILIISPSQYSYVFIFNCTSYWNLLSTYIVKPPFLLLLFPCAMQSYPGNCIFDKSVRLDI